MNPFQHGEVFVTDDGGRDRPRPRSLRAASSTSPLSRKSNATTGSDLPGGCSPRERRGAYLGQNRAGDPAHHRRDQGGGSSRLADDDVDVRDHRGRRHRRRHRDPPVPRGPSGSSARTSAARNVFLRARPRWCRSSVPRASRRPSPPSTRSTELRGAVASSPTPIRVPPPTAPIPTAGSRRRSPSCATCPKRASSPRSDAEQPLRDPGSSSHDEGHRRLRVPGCSSSRITRPDLKAGGRALVETHRVARADRAASGLVGKYVVLARPPTCRWSRRCATAGLRLQQPGSRSTGSRPTTPKGCSPRARLPRARRHRDPRPASVCARIEGKVAGGRLRPP